jgi:Bacterial Alpha-2-macroglobulin MG10 domain/Alpha-2-macroglobulin family
VFKRVLTSSNHQPIPVIRGQIQFKTHTHTHTHTHIYTYIYTYTHTRAHARITTMSLNESSDNQSSLIHHSALQRASHRRRPTSSGGTGPAIGGSASAGPGQGSPLLSTIENGSSLAMQSMSTIYSGGYDSHNHRRNEFGEYSVHLTEKERVYGLRRSSSVLMFAVWLLAAIVVACLVYFGSYLVISWSHHNDHENIQKMQPIAFDIMTRSAYSPPTPVSISSDDRHSSPSSSSSSSSSAPVTDTSVLQLVQLLPRAATSTSAAYLLSGKDAITLVFNRPLIALGSDFQSMFGATDFQPFELKGCSVPGKWRFVTTFVARFDPDEDWPPNLHFSVVLNSRLKAFDGAQLRPTIVQAEALAQEGDPLHFFFRTQPLTAQLGSIRSPLSFNATGGRWDPHMHGEQPELPPDADFDVWFHSPVQLRHVRSAIRIAVQEADSPKPDEHAIEDTEIELQQPDARRHVSEAIAPRLSSEAHIEFITSCSINERPLSSDYEDPHIENDIKCIRVWPKLNAITPATPYVVRVRDGVQLHPYAGKLEDPIEIFVQGLRAFEIPFNQRKYVKGKSYFQPQFRRYNIWLPHGLDIAGDTDKHIAMQNALKEAITIELADGSHVDFQAQFVEAAVLQIRAQFEPETKYRISVKANKNVLDAFQQPLLWSESEFFTSKLPQYCIGHSHDMVYFPTSNHLTTDWTYFLRGKLYQPPRITVDAVPAHSDSSTISSVVQDLSDQTHHSFKHSIEWDAASLHPARPQQIGLALFNQVCHTSQSGEQSVACLVSNWDHTFRAGAGRDIPAKSLTVVQHTNIHVSIVSMLGFNTVWVNSLLDGSPIEGASVMVATKCSHSSDSPVVISASEETAPHGLVELHDADIVVKEQAECGTSIQRSERFLFVSYRGDFVYMKQMQFLLSPRGMFDSISNKPKLSSVESKQAQVRKWKMTSFSDSSVYKRGDTIYIKGYIRSPGFRSDEWELASMDGIELFVDARSWPSPMLSASRDTRMHSGAEVQKLEVHEPVTYHKDTGDFECQIKVPASAGLATMAFRINAYIQRDDSAQIVAGAGDKKHGQAQVRLGMFSVTLSDPRPPTVVIRVEADSPFHVVGKGPVAVHIHASTAADAPIQGANVNVTWHFSGASCNVDDNPVSTLLDSPSEAHILPAKRSPKHVSGTQWREMFTDTAGVVTLQLLRKELPSNMHGSTCTLHVEANWVGPTREHVSDHVEIAILESRYKLDLADEFEDFNPLPNAPLPGFPFHVTAALTNHHGTLVSAMHVQTKMELFHVPGHIVGQWSQSDSPSHAPGTREDVLDWIQSFKQEAGQDCTTLTADAHDKADPCEFVLPSTGQFVLVARLDAKRAQVEDVPAVVRFYGQSDKQWKKSPLVSIPDPAVRLSSTSASIGDIVQVSFFNVFDKASILVHWGSVTSMDSHSLSASSTKKPQHKPDTKQIVEYPLEKGKVIVPVEIGQECAGTCALVVIVVVPHQADLASLPVELPTSPLFDGSMPHTVSKTFHIEVANEAHELDVALTVDTPTAAPGTSIEATVHLAVPGKPDQGISGTVAIYAVERAWLSLAPSVLPNPKSAFSSSASTQAMVQLLCDNCASGSAYAKAVATIKQRLDADPWVSPLMFDVRALARRYSTDINLDLDTFLQKHIMWITPSAQLHRFARHTAQHMRAMDAMHFNDRFMMRSRLMRAGGMATFARPMMAMARAAPTPNGAPEVMMTMDDSAGAPAPMMKSARMTSAADSSAEPGGAGSGVVRSVFKHTPFFFGHKVIDASGRRSFKLPVLDDIGVFELRAVAVSQHEQRFGSASVEYVVAKPLSTFASVPRFVRVGDEFRCGVTVTSNSDANVQVKLKLLSLSESLKANDVNQPQVITVSPRKPEEVTFVFHAVRLDTAASIVVSAEREDGASDSISMKLRVLVPQQEQYVATSMALEAVSRTPSLWTEGLSLPPSVLHGTGFVELSAGVGSLPAIRSLGSMVVQRYDALKKMHRDMKASAIGSRGTVCGVPSEVLISHQLTISSVAEFFGDDTLRDVLAGEVSSVTPDVAELQSYNVQILERRTSSSFGLCRCDVCDSQSTVDAYTTGDALLTDSLLASMPQSSAARVSRTTRDVWLKSVLVWFSESIRRTKQSGSHSMSVLHGDLLTTLYLAAGADVERLAAVAGIPRPDFIRFMSLKSAFDSTISHARATSKSQRPWVIGMSELDAVSKMLLICSRHPLLLQGIVTEADMTLLAQVIESFVRVQGRTAYLTSTRGGSSPASVQSQLFATLTFVMRQQRWSLLPKVVNFLREHAGEHASFGTRLPALAVHVLSQYDSWKQNTHPQVQLDVIQRDRQLAHFAFSSATTSLHTQRVAWESLNLGGHSDSSDTSVGSHASVLVERGIAAPVDAKLHFVTAGRGEISVALAMRFVPLLMPKKAMWHGITVERIVRPCSVHRNHVTDADSDDPILRVYSGGVQYDFESYADVHSARLGQSLCVTVQISSPDALSSVIIEDYLPGGLEPVDPNLHSSSNQGRGGTSSRWQRVDSGWSFAFRFLPTVEQTVETDHVRFYLHQMPAGSHSFTFQARAVTQGTFAHPPARAYCSHQEELRGATAGSMFTVEPLSLEP